MVEHINYEELVELLDFIGQDLIKLLKEEPNIILEIYDNKIIIWYNKYTKTENVDKVRRKHYDSVIVATYTIFTTSEEILKFSQKNNNKALRYFNGRWEPLKYIIPFEKSKDFEEFELTNKLEELEISCQELENALDTELYYSFQQDYPEDEIKTTCCIYLKNKETGNKMALWDKNYEEKFYMEDNDYFTTKFFSVWYEDRKDFKTLKKLLNF